MQKRFSGASFTSFRNEAGQFGVLLNKNQLAKGKKVLVPVGGAIEVNEATGRVIMSALNLTPADFEKAPSSRGVELRFKIADEYLPQVRKMFRQWDLSPERELHEELVDETGILTRDELRGYSLRLAGYGEETAPSDRAGGLMTLRMIAVYDFTYDARIAARLQEAAAKPDADLYFVDRREILAGVTRSGVEIASVTKLLLTAKL